IDLLPAIKTLCKVLTVMVVFGSGNIVLWGMAYMLYRKLNAPTSANAVAAVA
ncbi:hypothetical protein T492DRAFT_867084, partial [Pavlovales sp. CCMP2436]